MINFKICSIGCIILYVTLAFKNIGNVTVYDNSKIILKDQKVMIPARNYIVGLQVTVKKFTM